MSSEIHDCGWTPLVTCAIGTRPAGTPGHTSCHIARDTAAVQPADAVDEAAVRIASTAMLNGSPASPGMDAAEVEELLAAERRAPSQYAPK